MKKLLFILSFLLSLASGAQQHIVITPGTSEVGQLLLNGRAFADNTYVLRQFENGTRYNAWGDNNFFRLYGGRRIQDQWYSSAVFHGGNSQLRKLTYNQYGAKLSDVLVWDDPDESRRDPGGGWFIDDDGNYVHIIRYVQHDMTVANPPSVLWGMIGMGHYREVYDGTTGDLISSVDYPESFDPQGEPDFANYGNQIRHSITGRLIDGAYGTTNAGRTLLYYNDADGVGDFTFLSAPINSADQLDEGVLVSLDEKTGNDDWVFCEFKRNSTGKLRFFLTTDGGETYSVDEELSFTSTASKAPWAGVYNGIVYLYWADRASQDYAIRGQKFNQSILATGDVEEARIGPVMTVYESMGTSHPLSAGNVGANFGYPSFYPNDPPDEWLMGCYDQSPTVTADYDDPFEDVVQTDQMVFPMFREVRVKARSGANQTLPDGDNTQIILGYTAQDNYGAWDNNTFTAPKAGTYTVAINLPVTYYGQKVLRAYKYLAATPNTINSTVFTSTESEGLASGVGKLQGYFTVTLAVGDKLRFFVEVSDAGTDPQIQAITTLTAGVCWGIDISNAEAREIVSSVASVSQSFANSVEELVEGCQYTVDKTDWYKIRIRGRFPSAGGGRRIFNIYNYEVGFVNQETRRKNLLQIEDRGRDGTNTDTDHFFYYRLNKGETIKLLFTVYGADLTSVAGDFNALEITRQ